MFAGAFGLGTLALWLLNQLGSGTLLIAAAIAAIIALAVVGSLTAQLKQAVHRNAAADYIREGSFNLDVSYDRYLYETTKKRKIETGKQNK